jgi:hypothetical protein
LSLPVGRLRDAKGPGAIGRGGPIGGYVMDKLIRSRGLIAVRFECVREGLWKTETGDRVTGEPRGLRWVERVDGKYIVTKEDPR